MIEKCYEDSMETATFWILAETFIHTIYILQHEQPVHRITMEILMCNVQMKQLIQRWTQRWQLVFES